MEGLLILFVLLLFIIVITSILNEKIFKISNSIALLIVSSLAGCSFVALTKLNIIQNNLFIFTGLNKFHFDEFLLEGILCFMLFAGSSKLQIPKLVSNLKSIAFLSLLTTLISSTIYGLIFFLISYFLQLPINFWTCLLLGCIISPTDPIAATSILNKLGLPKGISSVIEGESLFNDGIAVALFVFIKNIITNANSENFFLIIGKNLIGAILIGFIVSFITFKLQKQTKNPFLHILISLLNVSLCYVTCEYFGFSGVISSVVCGLYFSYHNQKCERWKAVVDPKDLYKDFWEIIDELLNSILFVFIGLTIITIPINASLLILLPIAIIVNFISRYFGVFSSCLLLNKKNIPNRYTIRNFTKLMTFTALRGGVSLAMAFSVSKLLNDSEFNIVIDVTMITILFTTIVQGLFIPTVYKRIESKKYSNSLTCK